VPSAEEGPCLGLGAGPIVAVLEVPSGAGECWSGNSIEGFPELWLRSAILKVGNLDELWCCRCVWGQADEADVADECDEDDPCVEVVADELFLELLSTEDLSACWPCPADMPSLCGNPGITAKVIMCSLTPGCRGDAALSSWTFASLSVSCRPGSWAVGSVFSSQVLGCRGCRIWVGASTSPPSVSVV
jgi:hypothetical protein